MPPAAHERQRERILLALAILEGQTLDEDLAPVLGTAHVELVGYHEVPEQTAPSQMRRQFETQAERTLDEIATTIIASGGTVDRRLVFTPDRATSLDRVREDVDATAELLANPTGPVTAVLVPVLGELDPARLATFIGGLGWDPSVAITLLALPSASDPETAPRRAEAVATGLADAGMDADSIATDVVETTKPADAIIAAAIDHDVTIMPGRVPDWRSIIFGDIETRIARASLGPVFVVYPGPERADDA